MRTAGIGVWYVSGAADRSVARLDHPLAGVLDELADDACGRTKTGG